MASEQPSFSGMSTPFAAHHSVAAGTASYFGSAGNEQQSPTSNPFSFVGNPNSLGGPGQQHFMSGPPPKLYTPVVDSSGHHPVLVATSSQSNYDAQHTPATPPLSQPHLSHQHSMGSLNVASTSTIFDGQPGELSEDPFASCVIPGPRSRSSQAQRRDASQNDGTSGSVSAPVTGLITTHPEQDRNSLEPTPALFSLPSSSSGSLIERPPLSPLLPPTNNNIMTNAALSNSLSGCLPMVHSYPHLSTNATNATEEVCNTSHMTAAPYLTNAIGYPVQSSQASVEPSPELSKPHDGGHNEQRVEKTVEMAGAEKDYLTMNKERLQTLVEGDHSLSSSLNQSMSSLLESQEDITHTSPVQILPPAPEKEPLPISKDPPASHQGLPTTSTPDQIGAVPDHTISANTKVETPHGTSQHFSDHQLAASHAFLPPTQPHYNSGPDSLVHSDTQSLSTHSPQQMTLSPNPMLLSSQTAHNVVFSSSLPPHASSGSSPPNVSSGGMQEGGGGLAITESQLPRSSHLPGVVDPDKIASQQTTLPAPAVDRVQAPTVPAQERTNASLPTTSESAISAQPSPQVYTGTMSAFSVQQHQDVHPTGTNPAVTHEFSPQPLPGSVQDQTCPPVSNPLEGSSAQVSTQATDGLSAAQYLPSHSVSNPPMLPPPTAQAPLPAVLSNAHLVSSQPNVPSNAHPVNLPPISNTRPPPSETAVIQGVLSNAHLPPYTLQPLTGVQPPPAITTIATSDNTVLPPRQSQYMAPAVTTVCTTTAAPPRPPPQSVPLSQASITNNLPSTPNSVFVTSPPPPSVASSVATAGAPYGSRGVATGAHTVASGMQHTETQAVVPTQTQPGVFSAPQSLRQPDTQAPFSPSHRHEPTSMPVQQPPLRTSHPPSHSNTNAAANVSSSLQPSTTTSTEPAVHTYMSVSAKPVKSDTRSSVQQVPSVPVATSANVPHIPSIHQPSSQASGPTQVAVTTATVGQNPSTAPLPYSEHQQHRKPSQQEPPPTSLPHHPPPPTHHPHTDPGNRAAPENDRHWRDTAEIHHPRERERYDPYHDPYHYERSRHYQYDDPYYDYYRERPSSRAPHGYYAEHYEHDPYEYDRVYHRPVKEYDPYTGHYYYVDENYPYGGPHAYDPYSREFYEHPSRGGHHQHTQPYKEQSDTQMYAESRAHGHHPPSLQEDTVDGPHETTTGYPDQSTIYGAHDMFEEGGTFVDSPNVQGSHRHPPQQPPYAEGQPHSEYHGYPNYGHEPHVQPLWDTNEGVAPADEPQEPPPVLRRTPELFAHPHIRASFAPGGTLVVVLPHNLRAFQRAEVELSHVTDLVDDTVHANFFKAASEFPGPLMPGETPKSVAVSYATRQAEQCRVRQQSEEGEKEDVERSKKLHDEALLWDFLVLLCQHNGVVVASDISELLTKEKTAVIPTRTHVGSGDHEEALENVRQLLMTGRKRDALEFACSQCLWGHALMLASKMDEQNRTYVINRFTASLVSTDPLSTFYTLMLGRTPSAVKPDGLRRAGNWQHHLAMILANRSSKLDNDSMVTLGDSLLESGRLCAAHFCYHLADMQFGAYGSTTSKYLLLGVENSLLTVGTFPRPESLRKMEVFEYAMSLGKQEFVLPHFQVFKYLLALQLAQVGMVAKAFKYCEQIAVFIGRSPGKFPPTLLHVVDQLSTQLHHLNHPHGVVETELPSWLLLLQQTTSDVLAGNYVSSTRSTPSPAFSSVSQSYASQPNAFGQGRHQYLKVPNRGYKGSSIEPSTETSSKEGSVVDTAAANTGQDAYQPSPLAQQQETIGYMTSLPSQEQLQASQFPSGSPSEQTSHVVTTSAAGDGSSVVTNLHPPNESQVPYSGYPPQPPTATAEVSSTSGGDSVQPIYPPEQYANTDYGGFGRTSTAVPGNQDQQPQLGQEQHSYVPAPAMDDQQPHFSSYPPGYGYQGVQAQAEQYGYTHQPNPTEEHTNSQFTQPPPHPSEDVYGGQSQWGTQQWPSGDVTHSGASRDVYEERDTSQPEDSSNRREEEARRNEDDDKEKESKDTKKKGDYMY